MAVKAASLVFIAANCLFISAAQADVVIGVAGPLTGQSQNFGQSMLNGVKAAVDKINGQGGLKHEQVSIISVDDQCDTAKAKEAAQKLIAAQVDVVIGHFCSAAAMATAPIYAQADVPMIAPTANAPGLTEAGMNNVVRITTRIDAEGAFAAKRILAKRPNAKLALVDDGTTEMKAITTSFLAAYGKAPNVMAAVAPEQKDYAEVLGKMKAAGIDTLYVATQPADAGRLTLQAAKLGLDLKRYGPDALLADPFWTSAGVNGENTLVSFPIDPETSNEAKHLSADMKTLNQATDGPFFPAYAAVQLFAAAAEMAGAHGHSGLASVLKSGDSFDTVLGPMRFDAKGDGLDLRFNWYSWNNGVYQTIAPENP